MERQGLGEITKGLGASLIEVFNARRGEPTLIRFADGKTFTTLDGTGWGRDCGDRWVHVIAPCRAYPGPSDEEVLCFHLSEVECLVDPEDGSVLIRQMPAPGQT